MPTLGLTLTLREDCVLSERAATQGDVGTLDYLPGGTILGAAATRLYAQLPAADAFTLFHSGKVRFGNGLPLSDADEIAYPVPLCWHTAKGVGAEDNHHYFLEDKLWHLGYQTELPDKQQPQQLRAGYVTTSGKSLKPPTTYRLKTAISSQTGRAQAAALFGYAAVATGQRYRAQLQADADVPEALLMQLHHLLATGEIYLGRSRSAEYGRVQVTAGAWTHPTGVAVSGDAHRLTLWLLSDLAAWDDAGQPTLYPQPQWLGLPTGQLILAQSFIRTRRYSPWNAHRGGYDLERQVIAQGSVLHFELDAPLTPTHRAQLAAGLGMYREAGLGQVWVNPPLLATLHPTFDAPPPSTPPKSVQSPADTPLRGWLRRQVGETGQHSQFQQRARTLAQEYAGLLHSARKLQGLAETVEVGPSASQWGSVLALAKSAPADFAQQLWHEANGPCKSRAPGWQDEYWDSPAGAVHSFAKWVRAKLGNTPEPRLVQHLAREIMAKLKQAQPQKART